MNSFEKRDSVKKDYDLIAKQYAEDFGKYIEDLYVYEVFESKLKPSSTIVDLGAGTGRTFSYFNKKGFNYIGLDFSEKMRDEAFKLHGEFQYILDDMINIKNHFSNNSIDSVFAVYSLFHLTKEDFKKLFIDIYDILKEDGILLFSYQVGNKEEFTDEPYLGENGKNILYMNYQTNEEVNELLKSIGFKELYSKEKVETVDGAINADNNITVFKIAQKLSAKYKETN